MPSGVIAMSLIEVTDLSKKINGKTILDCVNFKVAKGEIFGLLGPNGAGKTTLMRILLGLLKPTDGRATVFDRELGDDDDSRRRVGFLLENDGLYERFSAYENMKYFGQLYSISGLDDKINELLELVGLSDRQSDRVAVFSKGMRRRLALARSLIHDPDVLFYDEPSSGLDPEAQRMVRVLMLRLVREKGRTFFLNSHDLDEVQRTCSRVAILKGGKIRASDRIENLDDEFCEEVLEIYLIDEKEARMAIGLLGLLSYIRSYEIDGRKITVRCGNDVIPKILDVMIRGGVKVEELKKVHKSLEDIYLTVVGKTEEKA